MQLKKDNFREALLAQVISVFVKAAPVAVLWPSICLHKKAPAAQAGAASASIQERGHSIQTGNQLR